MIICTWIVGSGPSPEAGQNLDYSNLAPPPPPHDATEVAAVGARTVLTLVGAMTTAVVTATAMATVTVATVTAATKTASATSGDDESPQHWSVLRAINTLNPPKKYIHKLGGLLPIHSTCRNGAQGLMWGARGPFSLAAAMVVAVVMPVVF